MQNLKITRLKVIVFSEWSILHRDEILRRIEHSTGYYTKSALNQPGGFIILRPSRFEFRNGIFVVALRYLRSRLMWNNNIVCTLIDSEENIVHV
jgi:hypothetical protein